MIYNHELLIAVDPGHGGWDNGAQWEGRLEKEDNLRLGLAVQKALQAQGLRVLMTRDTDTYVSLPDRATMANQAGADLFVSLHRNSYIEQTPLSNGVENFIYTTAPIETSGRAARYVLAQIVKVGVQADRGVQRANFYVLRRTEMPAMLLEMGYIIDEIDNQLFDKHLEDYAAAIARGVLQYFGLPERDTTEPPTVPPTEPPTTPPTTPSPDIAAVQRHINNWFGLTMPVSGVFDAATVTGMVCALQLALNSDLNAGLDVDGMLGPKTIAAFPSVRYGHRGNVVLVVQALLALNGHSPGALDRQFGPKTQAAAAAFQKHQGLTPDGVVGQTTLKALVL